MRIMLALAVAFALGAQAPVRAQEASPAPYETIDAMAPADGFTLSTRLYAPTGMERYAVVLLIAGAGNESVIDSVYTQALARAFTTRGLGVLAYDKRGTGLSGGTYTGGDFEALGGDAAALVRYLRTQPQVERVGLWGVSQAGWIAPYTVRETPDVAFAILVSPPGVNPHEQVAHFLYRQALSWGLTPQEAAETDRMHRAVALYYAGRASHRSAQAEVDSHRDAHWFHGVITHPYWDEMSAEGRVLTPSALAAALRERPGAFEIYREPSSFMNYTRLYRSLRLPTLVVYGEADELVPFDRSRAILEPIFRRDRRHAHDFLTFAGADHDIQTPEGRVRQDYLDAITLWAQQQFQRQD